MKPKKKAARPHRHSDEITAVYADRRGNICEAEGLRGLGRIGEKNVLLAPENLIPLPESADLMFMPEHSAVGQGAEGQEESIPGTAVAAILPQGYTRTHLPGFHPPPCRSMDIPPLCPIAGGCVSLPSTQMRTRNGILPTIMERSLRNSCGAR